jgi:hypothetical protein
VGILLNPEAPSILERDWTNAESHRAGDHRGCGHACIYHGNDRRNAPLYAQAIEAVLSRRIEDYREFRKYHLLLDLETWRTELLRTYCRNHHIRGYSRLRRADLLIVVSESAMKHAEGFVSCNPQCGSASV